MADESREKLIQVDGYRESRYRWVCLVGYLLAALVNSLPNQAFSSMNTIVSKNFSLEPVLVTLNVLLYSILNPVFVYPVNWILDRYGMRIGCSLGGILVIIGVWLRIFLSQGQMLSCLIGSILTAIGSIFILNSPSIVANNWFKPSSVPPVITVAVLASLLSGALGSSLPGLMVKQDEGDTKTIMQEKVINFLILEAVIVTVPIVLLLISLRNRPKTPPSKAAQNQQKILQSQQNYVQTVKKLFKNPQYIKVTIILTFCYGGSVSYLANLDQMLSVMGIKNSGQMAGQIILSATIAGILSSFLIIKKVKSTLRYKAIITISLAGAFLTYVLLQVLFILKESDAWVTYLIGACTGFFKVPISAVILAYASEAFYPLGQGSTTGYLLAIAKTFGFGLGLGSAALLQSARSDDKSKTDPGQMWKVYVFMGFHGLTLGLAFLIGLTTKNKLTRTDYEQTQTQLQPQPQPHNT